MVATQTRRQRYPSGYRQATSQPDHGHAWHRNSSRAASPFELPSTYRRRRLEGMAVCEVCGNDYWMSFEVHTAGNVHVFDSFECAIQRLAPACEHCRCRIIGHGVEVDKS